MGKPVRNEATISNHGKSTRIKQHSLIMEIQSETDLTLYNHGKVDQKGARENPKWSHTLKSWENNPEMELHSQIMGTQPVMEPHSKIMVCREGFL
jgi:hypothetical protein